MNSALLLLPDFALIALGVALLRCGWLAPDFWSGLEKLVYFVLFPALLFNAVTAAPLTSTAAAPLLKVVTLVIMMGIGLSLLARLWMRSANAALDWASLFQCGFRFNSYIALALAGRLGGDAGIALMGIVIGFSVPIVNMAAVWALARHSESGVLREMLRNPLLLATLSGLAFNFSGLTLPEPVSATLSRLGAASIALSLIAVGASLSLDRLNIARTALIYFTLVKMVLLPLATLGLARLTGLSGLGLQIALLFAALPTASSAYVLAQRMGGNGAVVAAAITIGTMLSAISIPFWMTKI